MMEDSTKSAISDAYSRAVRWQLLAIGVVAIASFFISGGYAAFSAVLGGAAVIVGSYAGVAGTRKSPVNTGAILITLLKAEAIKIVVIILLLLLIYKLYAELVPLALICGLAAAALISGAGLRSIKDENHR